MRIIYTIGDLSAVGTGRRIDDAMKDLEKHSQASLHPSEIVTLAILADTTMFKLNGIDKN